MITDMCDALSKNLPIEAIELFDSLEKEIGLETLTNDELGFLLYALIQQSHSASQAYKVLKVIEDKGVMSQIACKDAIFKSACESGHSYIGDMIVWTHFKSLNLCFLMLESKFVFLCFNGIYLYVFANWCMTLLRIRNLQSH